jgi:hypothetical protein
MRRHFRLFLIVLLTVNMTLISSAEPVIAATVPIPIKSMSLLPTPGTENTALTDGAVAPDNPEATVSVEPTAAPEPADSALPAISPEPTVNAEPTVTPELETPELADTPEPTDVPEAAEEPTITPTPFLPKTLQLMAEYDYVGSSTTGVSSTKISTEALQKKVKKFGSLVRDGMPYEEYVETMSYQWEDCTDYQSKPTKISIDISKTMNYKTYVKTLKRLSRYDGVYLYKIGESTEGRDLYAIEIDLASNKKKNVLMFTGSVHAREFTGGTFLVKSLVDLVQKAQTDPSTMKLLQNNKYVAVPIVNVDVREEIIQNQNLWSTYHGEIWKAYIDGTDGNRNFPGLSWGELSKGKKLSRSFPVDPAYAFYPGDYAGSNNETKALMKFLYHYIVVEKAKALLDMHQQGSVIYAGKEWAPKKQSQNSIDFRKRVLDLLNQGVSGRKYNVIYESGSTKLSGNGSTITDYSCALAFGARFSPAFGFLTFTDGMRETTLMEVEHMKNLNYKVDMPNRDFTALTIEIGYGRKYLGNSSATRKLLAAEYKEYNFDKLLISLPNLIK